MKNNLGLIAGFCIGLSLTTTLGIALDNFAIGISIGGGAGVAIGYGVELLYKNKSCKKDNK